MKKKSLKDLLLFHELAFILLIVLAAAAGAVGIHLWEKSSEESNRISSLVLEVQQTRGDLYRQLKELFDAYFLEDQGARKEYDDFTIALEKHFTRLNTLAVDHEETQAIQALRRSYQEFVFETSTLFDQHKGINNQATQDAIKIALNDGLESGLFLRYEAILSSTEKLLSQKQKELTAQQTQTKQKATILLIIPLFLALILLVFSRVFLNRAIVKPIKSILNATEEISAGNLSHKVPREGASELTDVSAAINTMAEKLLTSQETIVRTEKQAAQGLLVPMLAHNIRNPLASIRATAQVMESPELDAQSRESITGIISTVDRLERWTGSLLAYLHPLKPQIHRTSAEEVIEGAMMPLLQKMKEKNITLALPSWPVEDMIYTDQHLLEQVIYNLLLNAIDASPTKSTITIGYFTNARDFTLTIADEGVGMPFTPDASTSQLAPTTKRFGTGLGIPFSLKVCDALGGQISFTKHDVTKPTQSSITLSNTVLAKSKSDQGTLITMTFPKMHTKT
jgi:signal transduction histidine kinase